MKTLAKIALCSIVNTMNNLIQTDTFILILGVAQITLAVFAVFVLGLLIKIFSDISEMTGRAKTEIKGAFSDFSTMRLELKKIAATLIKTFAVFASTVGVKKMMAFLENWVSKPTKKTKTSKPRKVIFKSE